MPVPTTSVEFLDLVRDSGLVEETVLGPFLEKHPAGDTRELAEEMARAGLITKFQKNLLLQGLRRGFFIADKWMVLDQLGAGGMGKVFRCRHKVMRHEVAIKVLPTSFAKNREYVDRFLREARAAAALTHPNIVRAFDVDQDDRVYYLVMEYVDGCNLQDLVDDKGPLGIKTACNYISQAAAGLQAAHEGGLVHRDIKPGNLLVDRNRVVKVLDMGLAMFFQEQGKSVTQQYDANAILGTAEYLAPEQAVNSQTVDIRADIYSLGMTFYFLLTAKSPYGEATSIAQKLLWHQMRTPKSVREHRPEVPEEIAAIVDKMLAKSPADRFQTPAEIVKALAGYVGGAASEPAPVRSKRDTTPNVSATAPTMLSTREDTLAETKLPDTKEVKGPASGKQARDGDGKAEVEEERSGITKKKPKSGKRAEDDENDDGERDEGRRRKKPRSSKSKRAKAAGFWTPLTISLVAGGGVLALVVVGVLVWALSGTSTPRKSPPIQVAQNPPDVGKKVDTPPVPTPVKPPDPPPKPPEKKDEPKKVEAKKADPAPVKPPEKKPDPVKPPEVKKDPPKPPDVKPPVPQESYVDYYPKPGQTLTYDVVEYQPSRMVQRLKWSFKTPTDKDKNPIEIAFLKFGSINGELFKGGKIDWKGKGNAVGKAAYRVANGYVEYNSGADVWEPILPVKGKVKDSWKFQIPNGPLKTYTIEKADTFKGEKAYKGSHPAIVVRAVMPYPAGGDVVLVHTYAKGIGEVSRRQTLEVSGKSQLVLESKIVDE